MLRFVRRVLPQRRDAARLDEDAPDVDIEAPDVNIEAPQQYTEEPRPSSQTPLKVLKGHTRTVGGLAFFLDGRRIVSGSWDRSLIIWDVTVGEVEKKLAGHTGDIMSVAMAPDGRVFASGSEDGTLRFWDVSTGNEVGEPIHTLSTGKRGVWGLAFSPNSRRIATTGNHTIQIWDVPTRAPVTELLHIPSGGGFTVVFSHDGSRIAADAGGGAVGVWNSVSGKVVFNSLKGHTDAVMWTAFTPNGRQLVTASIDGTICRWDMKSGALIGKPLTGHSDWIYNGVLSRDGNTLATASADRTVRLWDLKTGNQKSRFLQHRFSVRRVALSRDGSLLATAGSSGDVYIWDMKTIEAEIGEDDAESETSPTRPWLDMPALRAPLGGATNYDHEGGLGDGYNRVGPSDATGKGREKADDEGKLNSPPEGRTLKQFERFGRPLRPSKKPKDNPASPPLPAAPVAIKDPDRTSPDASPMAKDPPAVVDPASADGALENNSERGVDTPDLPSTVPPSSRSPVSKFAGPWASSKSLWNRSRGDQPEITTIYTAKAEYPHVAAADPSEPAKVLPKSETPSGNYATHAVLHRSPPHTPTDDSHDDVPNENTDDHTPGTFCGLCSRLFSRRPTARPNDPGDPGSDIEMAELHGRTEDEATSATATSTRPVISTTNSRESSARERIDHPSAHDTERLPIEMERLRIEAQEKEAAASRAHELLIFDRQIELLGRQIELARIHAGYPAPGRRDPRQG